METLDELHVLEHLSYILEAWASDCPREGRFELGQLAALVPDARGLEASYRETVLARLDAAQTLTVPGASVREAAIALSGLSRQLWKRMLAE